MSRLSHLIIKLIIDLLGKNPVHVVLDTSLESDTMLARAFMSQPMLVDGHVLGSPNNETIFILCKLISVQNTTRKHF